MKAVLGVIWMDWYIYSYPYWYLFLDACSGEIAFVWIRQSVEDFLVFDSYSSFSIGSICRPALRDTFLHAITQSTALLSNRPT
jgi:hypothetical protein